MSKLLFMMLTAMTGLGGALMVGPIVPMYVYYFYASFRPQALWLWQLSAYPEFNWSLYTAGFALLSYLPWVFGIVGSQKDPNRRVFPYFNWAHRAMIAFGIWMTLSYLFSNNMDRSWIYYEDFLKIFIMYLLGSQVIRSYKQIHVLYLIVTFSLGYIAFEMVQIYFTTGYLVLFRRGFAGLDNNGAALVLAMGIPLSYFAWEFTRGWYRWGFLLIIPIIAECIMSSYSRGAMISALAVAPFYLLYSRKKIFLLICMGMMAAAVPIVAGDEIKERFFSVNDREQDDSFQSRMASFRAAYLIANDYPVFGAGIRCSNLLTLKYGADMEGRTIHNTYLQIAADAGWTGMLLYLLLLAAAIFAMWRSRRRLWKRTDEESVRAVAMLGGIECALLTFMVGILALSLELVEVPYLMMLIGSQFWSILNAQVTPEPGTAAAAKKPGFVFQARVRPPTRPTVEQPIILQRATEEPVPMPTRASVSGPPSGTKYLTPPTVPDFPFPPRAGGTTGGAS